VNAAVVERVRAVKAANPDLSNSEVGKCCGLSKQQVWRALNPERTKEFHRRSNAQRAQAKRAWERENDRGVCERCGATTGVGSGRRGNRNCKRCHNELRREARLVRAAEIERLWKSGASMYAIADELGWTRDALGVEMVRLRNEGLADLPYRRRPKHLAERMTTQNF
jgi:ribosomal protein L40E